VKEYLVPVLPFVRNSGLQCQSDLGLGDILTQVFLQCVVAGNLVLLAAFSCRRTRRGCLA